MDRDTFLSELLLKVFVHDGIRVFHFNGILHTVPDLFPKVLREFRLRIDVSDLLAKRFGGPSIPDSHRFIQGDSDVLIPLRNEGDVPGKNRRWKIQGSTMSVCSLPNHIRMAFVGLNTGVFLHVEHFQGILSTDQQCFLHVVNGDTVNASSDIDGLFEFSIRFLERDPQISDRRESNASTQMRISPFSSPAIH